jgi:hypothetical protein
MKNMPSMRFYALLAMTFVVGFSSSNFIAGKVKDADESEVSRACQGSACSACVEDLTVCGDAKVRGDLTVCGKISPQVAGPRGKQGKRGRRGRTGATGAGGAFEYAYIYNISADQLIAAEDDVLFDSNGILSTGIAHIPGQAQVRVANAGIYFVNFSVTASDSSQFALTINGVPLDEAIYANEDSTGDFANIAQNAGTVILSLAAGDIITIRNHTSFVEPLTLASPIAGSQSNVNAALTIMRIQ